MRLNLLYLFLFIIGMHLIDLTFDTKCIAGVNGIRTASDPETVNLIKGIEASISKGNAAAAREAFARKVEEKGIALFTEWLDPLMSDPTPLPPSESIKYKRKTKKNKNKKLSGISSAHIKAGRTFANMAKNPAIIFAKLFKSEAEDFVFEQVYHTKGLSEELSKRLSLFYKDLRAKGKINKDSFKALTIEDLIKQIYLVDFLQQSSVFEKLNERDAINYNIAVLTFISSQIIHNQYGIYLKLNEIDGKLGDIKRPLSEFASKIGEVPSADDIKEVISEELEAFAQSVKKTENTSEQGKNNTTSDDVEKKDDQQYFEHLAIMQNEISGVLEVGEALLFLSGRSKEATDIAYYGKYTLEAFTSAAVLFGTGGFSMISLGQFSNACLHLFTPKQPSENQLIMQQLDDVRFLMEKMNKRMNERFDRLESKLIRMQIEISSTLDKNFKSLEKRQRKIVSIVSDIQESVEDIRAEKFEKDIEVLKEKLNNARWLLNLEQVDPDRSAKFSGYFLEEMKFFREFILSISAKPPYNSMFGSHSLSLLQPGMHTQGIYIDPRKLESPAHPYPLNKLGNQIRSFVTDEDAALFIDYSGLYPQLLRYMNSFFKKEIFSIKDMFDATIYDYDERTDLTNSVPEVFSSFAIPSLVLRCAVIYDALYHKSIELKNSGVELSPLLEQHYAITAPLIATRLQKMERDINSIHMTDSKGKSIVSYLVAEYINALKEFLADIPLTIDEMIRVKYFQNDDIMKKNRAENIIEIKNYVDFLTTRVIGHYCPRKILFISSIDKDGIDPIDEAFYQHAYKKLPPGMSCIDIEKRFSLLSLNAQNITKTLSDFNNYIDNVTIHEKKSVHDLIKNYPFYVILRYEEKEKKQIKEIWEDTVPLVILTKDDLLNLVDNNIAKQLLELKHLEARGFGKLRGSFTTVGGVHSISHINPTYCPDPENGIFISFFWEDYHRQDADNKNIAIPLIRFKIFMPQNGIIPYGYSYLPIAKSAKGTPTFSVHGHDGARCATSHLILDFKGVIKRSPVSENAIRVFSENITKITSQLNELESKSFLSELIAEKMEKVAAKHTKVDALLALINTALHYGYYQNNYFNRNFIYAKSLLVSVEQVMKKLDKSFMWYSKDQSFHYANILQLDDFLLELVARLDAQLEASVAGASFIDNTIIDNSEKMANESYPIIRTILEDTGLSDFMEDAEYKGKGSIASSNPKDIKNMHSLNQKLQYIMTPVKKRVQQ